MSSLGPALSCCVKNVENHVQFSTFDQRSLRVYALAGTLRYRGSKIFFIPRRHEDRVRVAATTPEEEQVCTTCTLKGLVLNKWRF